MKTVGTQTIYDNVRIAKNIRTKSVTPDGLKDGYQGSTNVTTLGTIATCGGFAMTGDFAQTSGDMTLYHAANDANPTISLGSSATERLKIEAVYESGAQGLDVVKFVTHTAGGSSNDARFAFNVDETFILNILDGGLRIKSSGFLEFGSGNEIISDSSGTTTLKNIDALDATTVSTFNSALTAGDITAVTAGNGLTGGGASGGVALNIGAGNGIVVNDADVAVAESQTSITSIYNASLKLGRDTDNLIDFATTDNKITFRANGADQIVLQDGALIPRTTNDVDLGSSSFEFKDAYFDGTVTSDAFAGPLTGNVTGNCSGTAATVTSNTI